MSAAPKTDAAAQIAAWRREIDASPHDDVGEAFVQLLDIAEQQEKVLAELLKFTDKLCAISGANARTIAELRRDAMRYRWIRSQPHRYVAACWLLPKVIEDSAEAFDAAIDAAIERAKL